MPSLECCSQFSPRWRAVIYFWQFLNEIASIGDITSAFCFIKFFTNILSEKKNNAADFQTRRSAAVAMVRHGRIWAWGVDESL